MNSRLVKAKNSGELYEIQYVVHRAVWAPSNVTDVYACYRISNYDAMPIGSLVWISADQLIEEDRMRIAALKLEAK
jgi:hypothetical protein